MHASDGGHAIVKHKKDIGVATKQARTPTEEEPTSKTNLEDQQQQLPGGTAAVTQKSIED